MCFEVIKSPSPLMGGTNKGSIKIFLAGTIDMGDSEDWQNEITTRLFKEYLDSDHPTGLTIYNPRRDEGFEWSSDSEIEQIKWEMKRLDDSDIILMNFMGNSKSPISLLELGIYSKSGKLIVCCPNEFYRYNNVRLTCEKYKIPLYNNINEINYNTILNGDNITKTIQGI